MKEIYMILQSGEEIFMGKYSNLFTFMLYVRNNEIIVPMNGNENYTLIHNIYSEDKHQFVSYKSI